MLRERVVVTKTMNGFLLELGRDLLHVATLRDAEREIDNYFLAPAPVNPAPQAHPEPAPHPDAVNELPTPMGYLIARAEAEQWENFSFSIDTVAPEEERPT